MVNVPSQRGRDIAPDEFVRLRPLCNTRYQGIRKGADVAGLKTRYAVMGKMETYIATSISSFVRREISWPVPPDMDIHR